MSRFNGRRFLVTGGTGFIGSALVRGLLREGATVRSFDDNSRGAATKLGDRLHDVEDVVVIEGAPLADAAEPAFTANVTPGAPTTVPARIRPAAPLARLGLRLSRPEPGDAIYCLELRTADPSGVRQNLPSKIGR